MSANDQILIQIERQPKTWLVTGVAGFIGSHLAENLLRAGQTVIGLDNLSTGQTGNLDAVAKAGSRFTFIEGDIRDAAICARACAGAEVILHHAAIGSVPKSFDDPAYVDSVNIGGFLTMMNAAHKSGARRFIYASSSAVYGDATTQPNHEAQPVAPKSPYAVGKYANELYAGVLGASSSMKTIGFRYFNIYGPRQDPRGAYAAVIPRWIDALAQGQKIEIYGDGGNIRDFCHVDDVVRANILAALCDDAAAQNQIYNIASGQTVTLNDLSAIIAAQTGGKSAPIYKDARAGDIKISRADIAKAQKLLGFAPSIDLRAGIESILESQKKDAA